MLLPTPRSTIAAIAALALGIATNTAIALVAVWSPAMRASRVGPMHALRHE